MITNHLIIKTKVSINLKKQNIAHLYPIEAFLEVGRIYLWCACGRTKTEPFCDGSHQGTGIKPLEYRVLASKTVLLCQCKHSKNPPICDGSHKDLIK